MNDDELVERVARAIATVNGETHRWYRYEDEAEAALAAVDLSAVRAEAKREGAARALWTWEYALQYDREGDPTMDHPSSWRTVQQVMSRENAEAAIVLGHPRSGRNKSIVRRQVTAWTAAEVESGVTAQDPS